jgi:hypothetical protein
MKKSLLVLLAISLVTIFASACLASPVVFKVVNKSNGNVVRGAKVEIITTATAALIEWNKTPTSDNLIPPFTNAVLTTLNDGRTNVIDFGLDASSRTQDTIQIIVSRSGYTTLTLAPINRLTELIESSGIFTIELPPIALRTPVSPVRPISR